VRGKNRGYGLHALVGECSRVGQLPEGRELVCEIALRPGEPVCAVRYALGSTGGNSLGQGVARDSEPCGLGSGEDALRGGELVERCYVVRISHVAIVRF